MIRPAAPGKIRIGRECKVCLLKYACSSGLNLNALLMGMAYYKAFTGPHACQETAKMSCGQNRGRRTGGERLVKDSYVID